MSRLMVFGIGLLFLAMYTNNSFAYTITIDDNFDKFCHFRDGRIDYNILGKCTRWRSNIRIEDVPNECCQYLYWKTNRKAEFYEISPKKEEAKKWAYEKCKSAGFNCETAVNNNCEITSLQSWGCTVYGTAP